MNHFQKSISFFSLCLLFALSACTPETFEDADGIKTEFTLTATIAEGTTDGTEIKVGQFNIMDELLSDVKANIERKDIPSPVEEGEITIRDLDVRQLRAKKENSQDDFRFMADIKVELVHEDSRILLGSLPEGDNNFYFSELAFEVNEAALLSEIEPGIVYDVVLTANYTKPIDAPEVFDLTFELSTGYSYTSN
ncbi:MAG: hypothetical protein AAF206_08830 [Bacteroidota bacterium]